MKKEKSLYYKEYRRKNLKKLKLYYKRWAKENSEKLKRYRKKYNTENRERILGNLGRYYRRNKGELITKQIIKNRIRRKEDLNFRITGQLRTRLRYYLLKAKKENKFSELIGCNPNQFRQHIEDSFLDGMNWENQGFYGWHIDHIKPVSKFDLTKKDQQKKCFHYSNLRPLWSKDNFNKGNK